MKKNLITTLIVVIVAVVICWLLKDGHRHPTPIVQTSKTLAATNVRASLPLNPLSAAIQSTNNLTLTNEDSEVVLTNYQTLADLKKIKTLHNISTYIKYQDWFSQSNLVTFQLKSVNGDSISFTTDMMWALTDRKDDHVHELTLHSPWLDIDGVRQVGLQLEQAWGLNPSDFLAWCDKVGNKWLDAPLYAAGNGFPPAPEPYIGFSVRRTTNDEKPWVIVLIIKDRR